jgi:hypothetical protein
MVDAPNGFPELRSMGAGHLKMARVPSGRLKALARYAAAAWAASIARMRPERRITLVTDSAKRQPLLRVLTRQLQYGPAFSSLAAANRPVRMGKSSSAHSQGH